MPTFTTQIRPHVQGGRELAENVRAHLRMLAFALRHDRIADAFGQLWRLVGAHVQGGGELGEDVRALEVMERGLEVSARLGGRGCIELGLHVRPDLRGEGRHGSAPG